MMYIKKMSVQFFRLESKTVGDIKKVLGIKIASLLMGYPE